MRRRSRCNPTPWHDPDNGEFTSGPLGTAETGGQVSHGAQIANSALNNARSGAKDLATDTQTEATVRNRTVAEATNILTNETNGLSGGLAGELEKAKIAVANAIQNGLESKSPPMVAPTTLSIEAASSRGRRDDELIFARVHASRMAGHDDPVAGANFYGTSSSLINSRRIGTGRQDVLQRFGPFDHGHGPRQYVYIYGKPYKRSAK